MIFYAVSLSQLLSKYKQELQEKVEYRFTDDSFKNPDGSDGIMDFVYREKYEQLECESLIEQGKRCRRLITIGSAGSIAFMSLMTILFMMA